MNRFIQPMGVDLGVPTRVRNNPLIQANYGTGPYSKKEGRLGERSKVGRKKSHGSRISGTQPHKE